MKRLVIIFALLFAMNCDGSIDPGAVDPNDPNDPNDPADPKDPKEKTEEVEYPPAVELTRSSIKLLPFHVRMNKLSLVTGLPTTDPIFSELWRNRYPLGDHNYAQTIGPDLNWTAQKVGLWVRSIQPICNSDAMATKFPSMVDNLDAFWADATGTEIESEQRDDILAEVTTDDLDAAAQYQTVCVAVLSSAEFVAQ